MIGKITGWKTSWPSMRRTWVNTPGLLWRSTTNAFETKSLTSKEYQELVKSNSSDELDWYQRPGMSSEVAKFANKPEFSLKYIWDNHTKKMVSRLESVITTLVTAHTHVENG